MGSFQIFIVVIFTNKVSACSVDLSAIVICLFGNLEMGRTAVVVAWLGDLLTVTNGYWSSLFTGDNNKFLKASSAFSIYLGSTGIQSCHLVTRIC